MAWDVSSFDASRGQGRGRQRRGKLRVVRAAVVTSKALAPMKGMAGADDQLGFSFKKLVKGAIHYGNPVGLTYEAARLGTKLAKKTSIGRGIFDAVDYLPGGGVINRVLGGGGGGGGKKAAPARKPKPKRKIRMARPAAAPRDEGPPGYPEAEDQAPPEDMPGEDQGGGDEGGDEGGGDEELEEGEEGDAVDGLGGFWGKVAGGLKSAGTAVGKVGASIGKTALETYIGRPLGGQSAAQQQQALAKARAAATPFYKNPIVMGGAAVATLGAVVLLSKRGRGRR